MLNVLKEINSSTMIVEENNQIYIAKVISLDDLPLYKALTKINNINIVKFYRTEVVNGKFCIIEEYIQGETLENYVLRTPFLSDTEVNRIVFQICSGLSIIHSLGIVHRDINPTNIMICRDGTIKIIDFGIARKSKIGQTRDTTILGTQGYAAPEQFGFNQTTARSDIYSLGVLINFLKTKRLPNEQLAPGRLGSIVLQCIQIDDTKRFASINDLVKELAPNSNQRSFISKIPGFRQGVWWHIAIATLYYLFLLLLFLAICIIILKDFTLFTAYMGIFIFTFFLPVPILTNFGGWTGKLNWLAYKSKATKITIQIIFAILSHIISCIIILLYPVS